MGLGVDVASIDTLLPQTQCGQCGFGACMPYAVAINQGEAINRCPPGGDALIKRLAQLTGLPVTSLDISRGRHVPYRQVALVDEDRCIGCTKCLPVCPVDAIIGGPKRLHSVVQQECTGCELCIAPCPVDCITLVNINDSSAVLSDHFDAIQARRAYGKHQARMNPKITENKAEEPPIQLAAEEPSNQTMQSVLAKALARASKRSSKKNA